MSLSISHLNIKGIDSQSIGCKLKSQSFKDNAIAGYDTLLIKPNKKKHIKSERSSGGVIIIYKNFLKTKTDLVQTDQHYLWIKLKTKTNQRF